MGLTHDQWWSIFILFLAILSLTLGNSVVLFANRVNRNQFIRSLLAFSLLLVISIILWTFSIQVFARMLFDRDTPFWDVLIIVSASFTPFLLGFLILLPHLGYYFYALLRIWVMVNLVTHVMQAYQFNLFQALLVSLLGWLLLELISSLSFLRLDDLKRWFLKLSTGKADYRDPDDLVFEYVRMQRRLALEAAGHKEAEERAS